jgi:hypothetical protein
MLVLLLAASLLQGSSLLAYVSGGRPTAKRLLTWVLNRAAAVAAQALCDTLPQERVAGPLTAAQQRHHAQTPKSFVGDEFCQHPQTL